MVGPPSLDRKLGNLVLALIWRLFRRRIPFPSAHRLLESIEGYRDDELFHEPYTSPL